MKAWAIKKDNLYVARVGTGAEYTEDINCAMLWNEKYEEECVGSGETMVAVNVQISEDK